MGNKCFGAAAIPEGEPMSPEELVEMIQCRDNMKANQELMKMKLSTQDWEKVPPMLQQPSLNFSNNTDNLSMADTESIGSPFSSDRWMESQGSSSRDSPARPMRPKTKRERARLAFLKGASMDGSKFTRTTDHNSTLELLGISPTASPASTKDVCSPALKGACAVPPCPL